VSALGRRLYPRSRLGRFASRHVFLVSVALLLSSFSGTARAADRARAVVVLLIPSVADPLASRIEGELTSVGIVVRRIELSADADAEAVVASAMADGASAAIRVIPRSSGTEVWTSDTAARVVRRRTIKASGNGAALSVLAFRTVEFLRASLLEVPKARLHPPESSVAPSEGGSPSALADPAPPRLAPRETAPPTKTRPTPPPPQREPEERDRETRKREDPPPDPAPKLEPSAPDSVNTSRTPMRPSGLFDVWTAGALLFGSSQTSPNPELALAPMVVWKRIWAVGPTISLPLSAPTLTSASGSNTMQVLNVGGLFEWRLRILSDGLQLVPALCVGATRFKATGTSVVPDLGRAPTLWTPSASVSISAEFALSAWLALRATATGGSIAKRIVIDHAGSDVGQWGPLFGGVSIGLGAKL